MTPIVPVVRMLGAIPRIVRLSPPDWALPRDELAAAFGPRTKAILINSPMNPRGKVFTSEELGFIAGLLLRHDAYAICDEVYEHLIFDGNQHIPLMTLPGMRERDDAHRQRREDLFPDRLEDRLRHRRRRLAPLVAKAHQNLTFTTAPEPAACRRSRSGQGRCLLRTVWLKACRRSATGWQPVCRGSGIRVLPTARHRYFVTADFRPLGFNGDDVAFCRHITDRSRRDRDSRHRLL